MKTIRKTFQGVMPENKILNSESNSQTDTYSCDYINNMKVDAENIDELPVGTRVEYNGTEIPDGWEEVPKENNVVNTHSTSQTDTYSCNYINDNIKGKVVQLYGKITTKDTFTLKDNVNNYELIVIVASTNIYNCYTYSNVYNTHMNDLKSWTVQKLLYIYGDVMKPSAHFKMYDNILDVTTLSDISDNALIIYGVYGVKA